MDRASALPFRSDLEDQASPNAILGFLTINHPALIVPVRVVSDVMDYVVNGNTYYGVVFGFRMLTDNQEAPRTTLVIENVSKKLGQALRAVKTKAETTLEVRSSSSFDLNVSPRTELNTDVMYRMKHFYIANVSVSVSEITAEVTLEDFSGEPWPHIRATQDRLPGLFRR